MNMFSVRDWEVFSSDFVPLTARGINTTSLSLQKVSDQTLYLRVWNIGLFALVWIPPALVTIM